MSERIILDGSTLGETLNLAKEDDGDADRSNRVMRRTCQFCKTLVLDRCVLCYPKPMDLIAV